MMKKAVALFSLAVFVLLASFVVGIGFNFPGEGTPVSAGGVFINEVEINPLAGSEWVELYNSGSMEVNVSSWKIYEGLASVDLLHTIPNGTFLEPNGFYAVDVTGLNNNGEFIILRDYFDIDVDLTGVLIDLSPGNDSTWQRVPDGTGDFVFKEGTKGFTNNFMEITSKNVSESCLIFGDDVTLNVQVNGTCIEEVTFSVEIEGVWNNFTGVNTGGIDYSFVVPESLFLSSGNFTWTVYARDCSNTLLKNGEESFYFNNGTFLSVDPSSSDGLNGWYVTEPLFGLDNVDTVDLFYQWDSDDVNPYSVPFGLGAAPNNANITGGVLELNYWSNFSCGVEGKKQASFNFDFKELIIKNLVPSPGEMIADNGLIEISAKIDELHGGNSGVDLSSVKLFLNGVEQAAVVSPMGALDAIVNFSVDLDVGEYNVTVEASDKAGHDSSKDWAFEVVDASGFALNVVSPVDGIYESRRILFNLTTTEQADEIEMINHNDRNPRFRRLCRNCFGYGFGRKSFRSLNEGENNITIRATSEFGQVREMDLFLLVDSRKPRITRTDPMRGFNNGELMVEYIEENPQGLQVNYGTEGSMMAQAVDLAGCFEYRRRMKCNVNLDLSLFEGEEIMYFFELEDIIGRVDVSRARKIDVDTVAPDVTFWDYTIDRRRVEFVFDVIEENFDRIGLVDFFDSRPRERRLCSRLIGGVCEKRWSFRTGEHNLTLTAYDKAGNLDVIVEDLVFEIV